MANTNVDLKVVIETAVKIRRSIRVPKKPNNMEDFVTEFQEKKSKKISLPITKDRYNSISTICSKSVLIDDNYSDGNLTTTAVGNVLPEVPHIRRNSIVTSTLMSSSTSHKRIKRKLSETNETIKSECRKKMKTSTKMYYQSVEMDRELINVSTSCGIPIETLRKKVDNILKIFRKFYSESVEPGMIAITPTVEYTEAMSVIDGDRLTENVHADKSATKGEHDILDNLKLAVLSTLPSWTFHIEANRYISTDIRPFAIRLAF